MSDDTRPEDHSNIPILTLPEGGFQSRIPAPFLEGKSDEEKFVYNEISKMAADGRVFRLSSPKGWPFTSGIYALCSTYDKKVLVGQTCNFRNRWAQYIYKLDRGKYGNPYLQNSYDRHGKDAFVFIILEDNVPFDQLGTREAYWYNLLGSDHSQNGWNIQVPLKGGGRRLALETRAKLRAINLGHKHSAATRGKMSKSRSGTGNCNWGKFGADHPAFGRAVSAETRKLLSEANSGEKNPHYGRPLSREHAENIAKGHANRHPISLISPRGEVREFHSIGHAARETGIPKNRLLWFVKTANVGDQCSMWKLAREYDGPRVITNTTRRTRACVIENAEGKHVELTKPTTYARKQGIDPKGFKEFLKSAEIGDSAYGVRLVYKP
jgi:group I intron endonuclease